MRGLKTSAGPSDSQGRLRPPSPHPASSMSRRSPQRHSPRRGEDEELTDFLMMYQGSQQEGTELRMNKLLPLPGIGKGPVAVAPGNDDTPEMWGSQIGTDGDAACANSESEAALTDHVTRQDLQERHGGSNKDGGDSDTDVELELNSPQERRAPSPLQSLQVDRDMLCSSSTGTIPSMHGSEGLRHYPGKRVSGRRLSEGSVKVVRTRRRSFPGRRITADVHQLPPIQCHDIPERPDGPVPVTGLQLGGFQPHEESDIEEEDDTDVPLNMGSDF